MKNPVLLSLLLLGTSALGCSSVSDPALTDLAAYDAERVGLEQRMPDTAALSGTDPWNPARNLWATARSMSEPYNTFNERLALAASHAGPGNVLE